MTAAAKRAQKPLRNIFFDRAQKSTVQTRQKDYSDLLADIQKGNLPPVTFYKPVRSLSQHPGEADILSGDHVRAPGDPALSSPR